MHLPSAGEFHNSIRAICLISEKLPTNWPAGTQKTFVLTGFHFDLFFSRVRKKSKVIKKRVIWCHHLDVKIWGGGRRWRRRRSWRRRRRWRRWRRRRRRRPTIQQNKKTPKKVVEDESTKTPSLVDLSLASHLQQPNLWIRTYNASCRWEERARACVRACVHSSESMCVCVCATDTEREREWEWKGGRACPAGSVSMSVREMGRAPVSTFELGHMCSPSHLPSPSPLPLWSHGKWVVVAWEWVEQVGSHGSITYNSSGHFRSYNYKAKRGRRNKDRKVFLTTILDIFRHIKNLLVQKNCRK